jgi:uncharacterized protein (DUF305 family)
MEAMQPTRDPDVYCLRAMSAIRDGMENLAKAEIENGRRPDVKALSQQLLSAQQSYDEQFNLIYGKVVHTP